MWHSDIKDLRVAKIYRKLKIGRKFLIESLKGAKLFLLLPLHIEICIMKQFLKVLPNHGDTFKSLASKFPGLSEVELKKSWHFLRS
jgi:hypothetical protein